MTDTGAHRERENDIFEKAMRAPIPAENARRRQESKSAGLGEAGAILFYLWPILGRQ